MFLNLTDDGPNHFNGMFKLNAKELECVAGGPGVENDPGEP